MPAVLFAGSARNSSKKSGVKPIPKPGFVTSHLPPSPFKQAKIAAKAGDGRADKRSNTITDVVLWRDPNAFWCSSPTSGQSIPSSRDISRRTSVTSACSCGSHKANVYLKEELRATKAQRDARLFEAQFFALCFFTTVANSDEQRAIIKALLEQLARIYRENSDCVAANTRLAKKVRRLQEERVETKRAHDEELAILAEEKEDCKSLNAQLTEQIRSTKDGNVRIERESAKRAMDDATTITALETENNRLSGKIQKLEKKTKRATNRVKELLGMNGVLSQWVADVAQDGLLREFPFQQDNARLEKRVVELEKEKNEETSRLSHLEQSYKWAKKNGGNINDELRNRISELEQEQKDVKEASEDTKALGNKCKKLEDEIQELKERNEDLNNGYENMKAHLLKLQSRTEISAQTIVAEQSDIVAARDETRHLLNTFKEKENEMTKKIQDLSIKNQHLETELQDNLSRSFVLVQDRNKEKANLQEQLRLVAAYFSQIHNRDMTIETFFTRLKETEADRDAISKKNRSLTRHIQNLLVRHQKTAELVHRHSANEAAEKQTVQAKEQDLLAARAEIKSLKTHLTHIQEGLQERDEDSEDISPSSETMHPEDADLPEKMRLVPRKFLCRKIDALFLENTELTGQVLRGQLEKTACQEKLDKAEGENFNFHIEEEFRQAEVRKLRLSADTLRSQLQAAQAQNRECITVYGEMMNQPGAMAKLKATGINIKIWEDLNALRTEHRRLQNLYAPLQEECEEAKVKAAKIETDMHKEIDQYYSDMSRSLDNLSYQAVTENERLHKELAKYKKKCGESHFYTSYSKSRLVDDRNVFAWAFRFWNPRPNQVLPDGISNELMEELLDEDRMPVRLPAHICALEALRPTGWQVCWQNNMAWSPPTVPMLTETGILEDEDFGDAEAELRAIQNDIEGTSREMDRKQDEQDDEEEDGERLPANTLTREEFEDIAHRNPDFEYHSNGVDEEAEEGHVNEDEHRLAEDGRADEGTGENQTMGPANIETQYDPSTDGLFSNADEYDRLPSFMKKKYANVKALEADCKSERARLLSGESGGENGDVGGSHAP
ncbi:hypothetical protein P154DRAFT_616213 [Amniculicola lignicola CBS 123094]|uniref:Uncharacterized protein n=1 Tax=Amniculicola lignicola CBS 123094 TaxID=1392246 RepID=A0A6A5WYY5_9PLEO|nr:hypothetical protein P154DRAFT_616213 [Amniculicola lignicola CBS 123094]